MTVNISLDLQTWGNRPRSDIYSIGACVFDPVKGWENAPFPGWSFYMPCNNPRVYISGDPANDASYGLKYNLERDPKTIDWWSKQFPEAQTVFNHGIDLKVALIEFAGWLVSLGVDPEKDTCRIWSHGRDYDGPILSEAYLVLGMDVPWFYRAPRDTRTIFDDAGIENHSEWMKQHQLGTFHHALDNARSQAAAICRAAERIAWWKQMYDANSVKIDLTQT